MDTRKILLIATILLIFLTSMASMEKKIVINLAGRSLALYDANKKIRLYPIAIGKPSTPTPVGYYQIRSKDINPVWTDPQNPWNSIPAGPSNPLGLRWMQIQGNYGIHGTNRPDSIGHYVSNGCIRMFEENVEELFDMVEVGTPVEITYNRVVVEKTPENIVTLYVYPDNYNRQNLNEEMIRNWLKGYGVHDFIESSELLAKINVADGTPTYIAKALPIIVEGNKIKGSAVQKDGIMYLPLNPIAEKLNEKVNYNAETAIISTSLGNTQPIVKNNNLYIEARDLEHLFNARGDLSEDNKFIIKKYDAVSSNIKTTDTPAIVEEKIEEKINEKVEEKTDEKSQENQVIADTQKNAENQKEVTDASKKSDDKKDEIKKDNTKKEKKQKKTKRNSKNKTKATIVRK